jgi:hypothetical protein
MSKRMIAIVVGVLLLLTGGTIWAMRSWGGDPKVKELKQLAAAMADDDGSLSEEQKREKRREFGEAMRDATPEQREQFMQSPEVQARMEKRFDEMQKQQDDMINKFLALSEGGERTKFLDAQIDEELKRQADFEKRRKEWEARRQQEGGGQSSGSAGQGGNSPEQKTPAQGDSSGGRDGARRGFGGPGGPGNTDRMSQWAKKRLDRSTPEQRANRDAYRTAMNQRRADRGLQPLPDRGPFFGGGGFRGPGGRGPR